MSTEIQKKESKMWNVKLITNIFKALCLIGLILLLMNSCNDSSNPTLNPLLKEKNDENYVMMRVNRFPIFRLPQSIAQKLLTCLFKSKLEVKNDDKKIREKREEEWE